MRSVSGPALYRKKPPKIYVHLMLRFVTTELRDRRPIARGVMRCSLSLAKSASPPLSILIRYGCARAIVCVSPAALGG